MIYIIISEQNKYYNLIKNEQSEKKYLYTPVCIMNRILSKKTDIISKLKLFEKIRLK